MYKRWTAAAFALLFFCSAGCSGAPIISEPAGSRIPISGSHGSSSSTTASTSALTESSASLSSENGSASSTSSTNRPDASSEISASSDTSAQPEPIVWKESSDFIMPKMFSDNCVLQQKSTVKVWGEYKKDGPLTLVLGDQEFHTTCTNGKFVFSISTPAGALKSYDMVIHDGTFKKTIRNVAIGEVFLCGGQSNMVFFGVELSTKPPEATDGGNPFIRFTNTVPIPKQADTPQANLQGTWYAMANATFDGMSAFANYFSRTMFAQLNVPIGVVTCAMSDSSLAAWLTPTDAAKLKNENTSLSSPYYQHTPGQLYNTILYSFLDYKFKAAVWYQGESSTPETYAQNLQTFITTWRKYLSDASLPFVIVQLPGYDTTSNWPVLRQGQKDACNALANCAYSVNIDLGEKGNIHPQDKKPAAERAAYAMLNLVYGKNMPSPAVFRNASKNNGTITVEFQNAKGLKLKNNTGVGFEISTDGRNWTPVDPAKVSVSGSTVRISGAADAAHIRYAWASWPEVSLFNGDGLPAEPFCAALA